MCPVILELPEDQNELADYSCLFFMNWQEKGPSYWVCRVIREVTEAPSDIRYRTRVLVFKNLAGRLRNDEASLLIDLHAPSPHETRPSKEEGAQKEADEEAKHAT